MHPSSSDAWWWGMVGWARPVFFQHLPLAFFLRITYQQVILWDAESFCWNFCCAVFYNIVCCAVFDNYVGAITVGGKSYELGLFDTAGQLWIIKSNFAAEEFDNDLVITAGQEDYDRLRPLAYPRLNFLMSCF